MSDRQKPVIQPTGLVHGHSECRYLDETHTGADAGFGFGAHRPARS